MLRETVNPLIFVSVFTLSGFISCKERALTGTFLPPNPIPLSPEGLHQIEVSKLVQVHKGMEHCQVQLFPGRAERYRVMHRKESGEAGAGADTKQTLGQSLCPWGGWKFEPGPITGLAPGQEHSEHTLGRTICYTITTGLANLRGREKHSKHMLHPLSSL